MNRILRLLLILYSHSSVVSTKKKAPLQNINRESAIYRLLQDFKFFGLKRILTIHKWYDGEESQS